MKRIFISMLAICLLLSGCSWMDGHYYSVTPHLQHSTDSQNSVLVAENYLELRVALEEMIRSGAESCVISVGGFQEGQLEDCMEIAVRYLKLTFPIGAYAVDTIEYELGTSGGVAAVAVNVTYLHSRSEIQKIRHVSNMEQAEACIQDALMNYDTSLVMLVDNYKIQDLQQLADDFAADNPSKVMETPQISEQTYPNSGVKRVLELKFTYQTSRDTLRAMQEQVQRIFASAALYVSRDASDSQKYSQLYAFLMERFSEYQIKTSLTPGYSLLNHGVGDSRAFATIYSQMCRDAGLECLYVTGTRDGNPWSWNIVKTDGYYYHVDLLACQESGGYKELTDEKMDHYVWDYSAYPACEGRPPELIPEETTPEQVPGESTAPTETTPETEEPSSEPAPEN